MSDVSRRRAWLVVAALAVAAFALSLLTSHVLFPRLSADNDEALYVLEAQTLESGHLTLSASAHGDAFRPWMSGRVGDRLVLVVQPVLPALMAITDKVFGSMRIALALVAAGAVVAVFLFAREVLGRERVALAAAASFAASPLVIVQSGLYVSYLFATMLGAVVLTLAHRAITRPSRRAALWAGVVHGLLFFTRPLDGLLIGVALLAWVTAARFPWRTAIRTGTLHALGAVPLVATCFAYNVATTGAPLRFPLWALGGNDAFGFGDRSIVAGARVIHFGVRDALHALDQNLRAFPHWLLGGLVAVPLMAWAAAMLWRADRRAFWLLAAVATIFPAGYFFYYGNFLIISGRKLYGPHYYLALLLPATTLLGLALVEARRANRRWLGVVVVPLLVLGSAVEIGDKVNRNRRVRDDAARELAAIESAVVDPSIVVLPASVDGPYVLHPRGGLANPPDLAAARLYAADLLGANNDLFDRFPDRNLYRLQQLDVPGGSRPDVTRLTQASGPQLQATLRSKLPGDGPRYVYVLLGGRTVACLADAGAPLVALNLDPAISQLVGCADGPRTVPTPSGSFMAIVGITDAASLDPLPAITGAAVEGHYWLRNQRGALDGINPVDLWARADGAAPYRAQDPSQLPGAAAEITTSTGT